MVPVVKKKSSTYNETPQSSNTHKKNIIVRNGEGKVQESCNEGHKAYDKSGTCRKHVTGVRKNLPTISPLMLLVKV